MGNTYYIARHGQTEWNILGKTQGHGNSPLNGGSYGKHLLYS